MRFKFWQNLALTMFSLVVISLSSNSVYARSGVTFETSLKLHQQSFTSDWIELDTFSGLVLDLDIQQSIDDLMAGWVRFLEQNGEYSEWVMIHNDNDSHHINNTQRIFENGIVSNLINTNLSTKFQIRYDIWAGSDPILPKVSLVSYEGLNSFGTESIVNNTSTVAGLADINNGINIISRSAWGANESLNYVESYTEEDYETIEKFKEDPFVDRVVVERDGNLLSWPLQYSNNIKFVVVHHTATVSNLDNPRQAIRNIQQYHAVTRGWGDIGYNFLIDQQGNIYEGRDGGRNVIGGHTSQINKVSVGIALLGNFQEVEPSEAALKALTKLTASLANEYNLNVDNYTEHNGKRYPVVGGHYNFSATACPGTYGKKFLPVVRSLVKANTNNTWSGFEVTNVRSLGVNIDPKVTTTQKISPSIKNISGKNWSASNTYLSLQSDNKGVLPANMRLNLVSDTDNNSTGIFEGSLFGTVNSGYYEIKADLYSNNQKLNTTPLVLSLYVKPEVQVEIPVESLSDEDGKNQESVGVRNPYSAFFQNRNPINLGQQPTTSTPSLPTLPSEVANSENLTVVDKKVVSVNDPNIRILISKFDKKIGTVVSSDLVGIEVDGKKVADKLSKKEITVWTSGNMIKAGYDSNIWEGKTVRIVPSGENDKNVSQVLEYENRPSWNNNLNDNKFRGTVEFFLDKSGNMKLVNELGLESYLLGVAEVPDSEPVEKAKTIIVAARSYAYYYSNGHGKGLKFKGEPYHLDDSPDSSQKYLGYGFEVRNKLTNKVVEDTVGEVITWFGYDVVIPYFSQSDGRTRTPKEVWGWSNYKAPFLTSVDDTFCMNGQGVRLGHGVGISGCGATEMAKQGYKYDEIINYYLKGVKLTKRY